MVLTTERIRALWENYNPTQGIESFARSVEAEARRDALEEAAKVCDAKAHEVRLWCNEANVIACAAAIRKLKEDS